MLRKAFFTCGFLSSVTVVGALLSGCSTLFVPDTVVSESEFSISRDTLFVTQLSPSFHEMDSKPGANTSYLVAIEKDGTVKALKIEPMEYGDPQFMGKILVAIDREYDYFINDTVTKREHKKTEMTTEMAVSSTGEVVFAVLNHGYAPDGETYINYTETIAQDLPENYQPTENQGIFLAVGECQGTMYGSGKATGRTLDTTKHAPDKEVSAFAALNTPGFKTEKLLSTTESLPAETSENLLPCIGDRLIQVLEDGDMESFDFPDTGFVRIRNIHTGDHKDVPLTNPDGSTFTFERPGLIGGAEYDHTALTSTTINWLGEDGGYWETNIETGATQKLFSIPESQEFIDAAKVGFSPHGIHMLYTDEDTSVIKSFSKENGALIQELNIDAFSELATPPREFWNLAVAPWVD